MIVVGVVCCSPSRCASSRCSAGGPGRTRRNWRVRSGASSFSTGTMRLACCCWPWFWPSPLGSTGTAGRSFMEDLAQADGAALSSAFIGGAVFNLSNILLVAAIDIAGMAVAFPIGVGLALVLGVVTNYLATPVGNPVLLFLGVALVVVAIILSAVAYSRLPTTRATDHGQRHPGVGRGRAAHGILLSLRCRLDVDRLYQPRAGQTESLHRAS